MLVEIDLLDYLAYQMGCGILSDLRLFQQSERLFGGLSLKSFGSRREKMGDYPY